MFLRRLSPWQFRAVALLLAVVVVAMVQAFVPGASRQLEALAGDVAWRTGANQRPERRVVVVDIDEASLRAVGPWPWPRTTIADLADRLARAGAAAQVYDIGFPDARPGDDALVAAWSKRPVVLGQLFSLDTTVTPEAGVIAGRLAAGGCPDFAPKGHGAYGTAAELLSVRPAIGHMTPRIEGDGVVRQVPALVCHRGAVYPALSLTALWRLAQPDVAPDAAGADPALAPDWQWHVAAEQGVATSPLAPPVWLSSPSFPGLVVPLDAQGNLRVPYRVDRKAFASIPAAKVLAGDAETLALLKGAVVLVGATAFGVGDVVATPQAAVAAGLEVHAQALVGLLDRRIPYEPRMASLLQAAAGLAVAGVLLLVALRPARRSGQRLPAVGLILAIVIWLGASMAQLAADLWLPWAPVALFALVAAAALTVVEYGITLLQRERLSAHLGAYLPQPVAQRLMASDPTGRIQVEERDVSVLVADLRNFSAFAAHRPAEETIALLHAFSSIAVDVVERHGGVVERVAGDSILAVWNAFSKCEAHAEQAMAAARELLAATRTLLTSNRLETDGGLLQPLALGIGLESGTAIVGSFGPARRRAHAALGEPVSIASRLQEMTIDLSVPILAGPRLAAALRPDSTESLGEYLLEGLGRHCRIYAPAGWADLVPVDPGWATAATATERQPESRTWTRWHHSGRMPAAMAGRSSSRSDLNPRNA